MNRLIVLLAALLFLAPQACRGQLAPPNPMGVTMGHLHYHVANVEANRKFWTDLGATPITVGQKPALQLPGVIVMIEQGESSGGSEGSVINHVGFRVPDVPQFLARMKSLGYRILFSTTSPKTVGNAFSPEGERIEVLQDMSDNLDFYLDSGPRDQAVPQKKMSVPIAFHHIHFYVPGDSAVAQIKAWYVKNFGAVPGRRFHYEAADLPGMNLNFLSVPAAVPPTRGRMLDHIGFEVSNLEAFCKNLEAGGVKLDTPYKKLPSGIALAFLTDPWGTRIELTEGLAAHP
jgi:catechol 2,3-dioxygenase-like lactoylglutathione lyase family enzyme